MSGAGTERAPARVTLVVLGVLALINFGRGGVHLLLPDSGAGVIAHFDLTHGRETIVFLLATIGAAQIAQGGVELLAITRYRALATPLLAIETAKSFVLVVVAYWYKPPPIEIPGRTGMAVSALFLTAALAWEILRRRRA